MYFALITPPSSELSTYNRFEQDCIEFLTPHVSFLWQPDTQLPAGTRVRGVFYGENPAVTYTAWKTATAGQYLFEADLANGYGAAAVEIENRSDYIILAKQFIVNTTNAPLPNPKPWAALTRLELGHAGAVNTKPQQIVFPGTSWRPYEAKVKPRALTAFTSRPTRDQIWARTCWAPHVRVHMFRSFKRSPYTKTPYIAAWQKYSYDNAISLGSFKAGLQPPVQLVREGTRNWTLFGYIVQAIIRRGGGAEYLAESNGRILLHRLESQGNPAGLDLTNTTLHFDSGYTDTILGWRPLPEMIVGRSANNPNPPMPTEEGYEYVGDFSLCKGFKRVHEMWSVAVALRKPDNSIDIRDGLDGWFTSTLDHWVGYYDIWRRHPDVSQFTGRPSVAQFPPAGYTGGPRDGKTHVVHLFGNPATIAADGTITGTPSTHINKPWFISLRRWDEKLYITNFGSHSIARGNTDGTGLETILRGNKTDAQLGIFAHLQPSSLPLATIRTFMKDGLVSDPTTSCIAPQAGVWDSKGDFIFGERYSYAIRKLSFQNGQPYRVDTLCLLPVTSFNGSSATQDIALAIDDGSWGAIDDVFISAWAGSMHWRMKSDGTLINGIDPLGLVDLSQKRLSNGQWSKVDPPNYAWGIDQHAGKMVWHGNAGGSQMVELTKKVATDPVLTSAQDLAYIRGEDTYHKYFLQTRGAYGYGELGYPNVEEMGSWTDAQLLADLLKVGGLVSEASDYILWVRHRTCDFDYSVDITPPAPTLGPGALTYQWSNNMWNVTYRNTASVSPDVKKAVLYLDGIEKQSIDVTPAALFTFNFQLPPDTSTVLGVSFRDAVPNESAQVMQTVQTGSAPDVDAPLPAPGPGTVIMSWTTP